MALKKLHGNVVATEQGEKMQSNRFQLDEEKADIDNDGIVSSYERAKGEAVQKAMADKNQTGMNMGGMMSMDSDPFAPFQVVVGMDKHSGNNIPAGSKDEEVRDDIPAMLSEGEYVVPADVVRYHGLKTFEELRCEAKSALGLMAMHDRIAVVDDNTKEPVEYEDDDVEYEIEEKDAPEVEEAEVRVIKAEEGVSVEVKEDPSKLPTYLLQYVTDPKTNRTKMMYVDSVTGAQVTPEEYNSKQATKYSTDKVLEGIYDTEEEEEQAPSCPAGQVYDETVGACVAIASQGQVGGEGDGDGGEEDPGRGNLGLTEVEIDGIFSEVDPDYKALMTSINTPSPVTGVLGMLAPGLGAVKFIADKVRKTMGRIKARDKIRSGENIGTAPIGEYKDWRGEIDVATAASIAQTESDANKVASGERAWNEPYTDKYGSTGQRGTPKRSSPFGSEGEAIAVSTYGSFSDQQFAAIDAIYAAKTMGSSQNPEISTATPAQKEAYAKAEEARQAEFARRSLAKANVDTGNFQPSIDRAVDRVNSYDVDPYDRDESFYDAASIAQDVYSAKGGFISKKNKPSVALMNYSKRN